MKIKSLLKAAALCACLSILFLQVGGCKKKPEQAGEIEEFKLSGDLLNRIPDDSIGFFQWDASHGAYKKMLDSPWAGSGDFFSVTKQSKGEMSRVFELFSRIGLPLEDEQTWRNVLSQAVFFLALPSEGEAEPDIGVLFRSGKDFNAEQTIANLKAELEKEGIEVADLDSDGAAGITFKTPAAEDPRGPRRELPVTIATNDGLTAVANKPALAVSLLADGNGSLPAIAQTERLKKVAAGMPGNNARFAFGFADLQALREKLPEMAVRDADKAMRGLEAVAISFAMTDTPETDFRVLYDESSSSPLLSGDLKPALGEDLLESLPKDPILFLSLDGRTLRALRDSLASQEGEPAGQLAKDLDFLDGLGRIGLVATLARPGTSFLPIPNFMLMFESESAEQTADKLRSFITERMAQSGLPAASNWTEKEIAGIKSYGMQGMMGIGAFVAPKDNLVLLSTSEAQLKEGLQGSADAFVETLSRDARTVFSEKPTLGSFYLDFDQVATFMENMGGVLSMYAPQDQGAQKLLKKENIDSLRQMGAMIGTLERDDGRVGIRTFYQKAEKS